MTVPTRRLGVSATATDLRPARTNNQEQQEKETKNLSLGTSTKRLRKAAFRTVCGHHGVHSTETLKFPQCAEKTEARVIYSILPPKSGAGSLNSLGEWARQGEFSAFSELRPSQQVPPPSPRLIKTPIFFNDPRPLGSDPPSANTAPPDSLLLPSPCECSSHFAKTGGDACRYLQKCKLFLWSEIAPPRRFVRLA